MQNLDGTTVYSATHLVGFLACENLTTLERAALHGDIERPIRDDPELAVLQQRGEEHERRFLAYLRELGHEVVDGRVSADEAEGTDRVEAIQRDAARTLDLTRGGADVIYQATDCQGRRA
jgi:hypothetical protein